jgi:peptide/nickel transport system substrate-binding protein
LCIARKIVFEEKQGGLWKMKKWNKVLASTTIVALAMGALVGCGNNSNQPTNTDQNTSSEKPVDGGTLTLSMYSAPSGKYNPLVQDDIYDQWAGLFTFEYLMNQNGDLSNAPALAKSWDVSDDKKTITFHLRDTKWQDGQPFTADDVAYSFNLLASKDYNDVIQGPFQYQVSDVQGFDEVSQGKAKEMSGVKVIDPHTISVTLKEPNAAALSTNGLDIPIIPKHIWEKIAPKDWVTAMQDPKNLVGTGPYKIVDIKPNESVTLEKYDDYWGGKPHIDKIVWKVVNQDVAAGLIKNGEIDEATWVPPSDFNLYKSLSNVKIFETADWGYQYLGFKLNNPKLQDKTLRQAIAYAINRKGLVDSLLGGHGVVLDVPISPASWALAPKDQINTYPYDPEKAKKMLDDAGYKVGPDGFRTDKNGKPLTISLSYPTGNKVREKSAPIILQNLKDIGLNVTLNPPKDFKSYSKDVQQDKAEMWLMGFSVSTDPDQTGLWGPHDQYNYYHWNNPQSDALIKDAISAKAYDQNYRKQAMFKWEKLFTEELPMIPLYSQNDIYVYNKRLHGVTENALGILQYPEKWWLSK